MHRYNKIRRKQQINATASFRVEWVLLLWYEPHLKYAFISSLIFLQASTISSSYGHTAVYLIQLLYILFKITLYFIET